MPQHVKQQHFKAHALGGLKSEAVSLGRDPHGGCSGRKFSNDPPGGPVAKARHIQRAAASPQSSGRVSKAMAACGATR
jgi:hypothetical protein